MNEYVTIPKGDPQLKSHLSGTFSKTQRALPIKSLNVNPQSPHITFKLVDIAFINRPLWPIVLLKALRWNWLPLTLMPILFIYFDTWPKELNYTTLAVLSLLCLHFFVFLLNDYSDYMFGADRTEGAWVNPVLENGWMSAKQVYHYALIFLVIGIFCGLPILLVRPLVLLGISALAAIGLVGYSLRGVGFKGLGLGELVVYSCFGPPVSSWIGFCNHRRFQRKAFMFWVILGRTRSHLPEL